MLSGPAVTPAPVVVPRPAGPAVAEDTRPCGRVERRFTVEVRAGHTDSIAASKHVTCSTSLFLCFPLNRLLCLIHLRLDSNFLLEGARLSPEGPNGARSPGSLAALSATCTSSVRCAFQNVLSPIVSFQLPPVPGL